MTLRNAIETNPPFNRKRAPTAGWAACWAACEFCPNDVNSLRNACAFAFGLNDRRVPTAGWAACAFCPNDVNSPRNACGPTCGRCPGFGSNDRRAVVNVGLVSVLILLCQAAGLVCATPIAGADTPATVAGEREAAADDTLFWTNGDSLSGKLLDATSSHLRWQSPIFASPFSLQLGHLGSVRFAQSGRVTKPNEPIRFVLLNGDVLYGQLVDVTKDGIVVQSARHGQCRLRRSAVRSFRQPTLSALDSGPFGPNSWRTLSHTRKLSEWQTNVDGQLSTNVVGAELFSTVELASTCEIRIELRWTDEARFLVALAPPNAARIPGDSVKLEVWGDELVLQTLASDGNFVHLQKLTKDVHSLQFRLHWNQELGELSAHSSDNTLLGKLAAAGESGRGKTCLYIQNRGSDLTLVYASVSEGHSATFEEAGEGQSCVYLTDGDPVLGRIQGFDKSSSSLLLVDSSGKNRTFKMDRVVSVQFKREKDVRANKSQISLAYCDGALLRGTLEAIGDGRIALKTVHSDEPISSALAGVRELKFRLSDESTGASEDVIEFDGGKLHGRLAPGDIESSPLGWLPVGSANASPLPEGRRMRIVRETDDSGSQPGEDAVSDVLHLRNGDIVPGRLETIDETHVSIKTAFVQTTRISQSQIKAIELNMNVFLPTSGFGSRGWIVTEGQDGAVKRTDKQAVFHKPATLRHGGILRGNEIRFDVQWDVRVPVALTISPFTGGVKQMGPTVLSLYFTGQQVIARGQQGQARQPGRQHAVLGRPHTGGETRANLKLSFYDKEFQVSVDGNMLLTQPFTESAREGNGIILTVQRLGANRQRNGGQESSDLLTIANLEVGHSEGVFHGLRIDDESKRAVLTVPRQRKKNPPTHVLVAQNGDLLRGRLLGLTADHIEFTSRLDDFTFPRQRVAGIIWLDAEERAESSSPISADASARAILAGGATVSFTPNGIEQDELVGRSGLLGEFRIPIVQVHELHLGGRGQLDQTVVAYADWELRPAKEPQFAGATSGADLSGTPPGQRFGMDSPLVGTTVKDVDLGLLDGGTFRLSEHRDKVVILDFWATWCGPCVRALPQVIATADAFPRDKVLLVAVNHQETAKVVRECLKTHSWEVTVALDRDGDISRRFQVDALPQAVVIGKEGRIERLYVGARADLAQELKDALLQMTADKP